MEYYLITETPFFYYHACFSENINPGLQQLMKELNYTEEEITLVRNAISQESINLTNCRLDGRDRLLTQMITQWTEEKPLLKLCLISCSMSQTAWNDILQCLSSCKHVIHLNLSGNFLGEAGHQLAQSIISWGDEPALQKLNLNNWSLTANLR